MESCDKLVIGVCHVEKLLKNKKNKNEKLKKYKNNILVCCVLHFISMKVM
jgi:hypothetical protein